MRGLPAEAGQVSKTGWLGIRQITVYASISERRARSWIHSPTDPLPAVRVRGKILVRRSELDAWLLGHPLQRLEKIDLEGIVKGLLYGRKSA